MISLLLAIISFVVQIPVKTAILAKEVALKGKVDTVHTNSNNSVKGKSKSRLQALKDKLTRKKTTDKKSSKKEKVKRLVVKALKTILLFLKSCVCLFSVLCFIVSLLTVFAGVFLFLILGTVAVIILNNKTAFTTGTSNVATKHETKIQTADTSSLVACCKTMAEWYIKHVDTYQTTHNNTYTGKRQLYPCDLIKGKAGDDCTGFASAYAMLVTGKNLAIESSYGFYTKNMKDWIAAGWTKYTITELGGVKGLQAGDMLVCSDKADKNCVGGHAEIYLGAGKSGKSKTFGWGKIRTSYPSGNPKLTNVKKDGNKIYISDGGSHVYGVVWRYTGGSKK